MKSSIEMVRISYEDYYPSSADEYEIRLTLVNNEKVTFKLKFSSEKECSEFVKNCTCNKESGQPTFSITQNDKIAIINRTEIESDFAVLFIASDDINLLINLRKQYESQLKNKITSKHQLEYGDSGYDPYENTMEYEIR